MTLARKAALAVRIWALSLYVRVAARRMPLPQLVAKLAEPAGRERQFGPGPVRIGVVVVKVLTVAGRPPRCLIGALVAFRLHRLEGRSVHLVIGLPASPTDKDAHAWLELGGRDIGPPPGQYGHIELTRYS